MLVANYAMFTIYAVNSLVYAMAGRRYPVFVQQSSSTPVRAGKAEERCPSHWHLCNIEYSIKVNSNFKIAMEK